MSAPPTVDQNVSISSTTSGERRSRNSSKTGRPSTLFENSQLWLWYPNPRPDGRGLHLQLVDAIGDPVRVIGGQPAVGRDEGVDDRADAQLDRRVERASRVIRIDHRRMPRRRGERVRRERPLELLRPLDERVRLDLGEPDLRDPRDRTLQVFRDRIPDRVQLHRR